MDTVRWAPWSSDAFALARAESRPVLLSIVTAWSESCLEMDRTSYAAPTVIELINSRFVPIRVDADRRPDISDRYTLGGWPTTAFLDADGRIVGGGTYISVQRMPDVLARVLEAFRSRRDEMRSRRDEMTSHGSPAAVESVPGGAADPSELSAIVFATFDREYGGFGIAPKVPLTSPIALALDMVRANDDRAMARIAERTLDAMGWGGLFDDVDGGFYRCAMQRDWQEPRREKLLEVNASLLAIYAEASAALGVERYRERAGDVLRYVQTWLADQVDGGWYGSQRAGTAQAADGVVYTAANARMASAALRAAELLDDTALGEFAVKSLERVVLACYRPGQGIAHGFDGESSVRGLLDDQLATAAALLDAHTATGNIVYEMMAQELAHYAVRVMWDDECGGFFDRSMPEPTEVGLMRTRLKPFVANCEAARVLKRLAGVKGDHDFGARAGATLQALAPRAAAQGPLAADYLLALRS